MITLVCSEVLCNITLHIQVFYLKFSVVLFILFTSDLLGEIKIVCITKILFKNFKTYVKILLLVTNKNVNNRLSN